MFKKSSIQILLKIRQIPINFRQRKASFYFNPYLTWAFFEPSVMGGGHEGPHHNFAVIAPMIIKFGTGVKLDVFYTTVTKKFVTSLILRQYDVITCILANA